MSMISSQIAYFKLPSHPLIDVLKQLHNSKIPYDSDPEEVQDLSQNFSIPNVDKTILQQTAEMLSQGKNEKNIITSLPLNFTFDPELFQKFYKIFDDKKIYSKALLDLSYFFIFSWIRSEEKSNFQYYYSLLQLTDFLNEHNLNQEIYLFLINMLTLKYSTESKQEIPLEIIQKYFPQSTKENIYTLVDILDNSIQQNNAKMIDYLLHNMTFSFEKNIEQFKNIDFSRLIKIIGPLIYKFDPGVLAMLTVLPKITTHSELLDCFRELPSHAFLNMQEREPFEEIPATIGTIEETYDINSFSLLSNITDTIHSPSFGGSIDDFREYTSNDETNEQENNDHQNNDELNEYFLTFEPQTTLQDLILQSHKYIIAALAPIIGEIPQEYANAFFESFTDLIKSTGLNRFDLYADFLALQLHPNASILNETIFDQMIMDPIFSSESIFFSHKFDKNAIIRYTIINYFASYNQQALNKLLTVLRNRPFIFAEVIGILQSKLSSFSNYSFINHETLSSMIHCLDYLWTLFKKEKDKKIKYTIQTARRTIYMFIFSIIEDQQTAYKCFSSPNFATGFFSRVFEKEMKELILQSFSKFLIQTDSQHSNDLIATVEFISALLKMSNDPQMTDLIQCINSASMINSSLSMIFKPLIEPVCVFLSNNPSTSFLRHTLNLIMQAYLCIPDFSLSLKLIHILSQSIQIIEGEEPTESTFSSILGMIALSRSVKMPSMMILERHELILLFFSLFRTSQSTKTVLEFFQKLCQHSIRNCIICNKGELDLFLLESVKHINEPFSFRQLSFDLKYNEKDVGTLIMPIVSQIAIISSSPQVASSFISLATPLKDKVFPSSSIPAFTTVSKCLSDINNEPSPKIPLSLEKPTYFISGVNTKQISQGFTAMFWLRVDVPYAQSINKHPLVFSLLDEGNAAIKVFLSGSSLILKVLTTQGVSSALLTGDLPSCKWSHITLVFKPQPAIREATFEYILNGSNPSTFIVTCPSFNDSELEIKMGGVYDGQYEDEDSLTFSAEISQFAIYPTIFNYKNDITPYTLALQKKYSPDPLYTFPTIQDMSSVNINKTINLIESFNANYTNVLPFFAYIDVMPTHFLTLLMDILKEMITNDVDIDFAFIAYLIQQNNPDVLTYSLWNKFFSYMEFLQSKPTIANGLMKYILASAELWHNAPAKELQRILNSWPNLVSFGLFESVTFRNLLSYLRIYFYFTPVETELIRPRRPDVDIESCIQSILKVLEQYKMEEVDMEALISHCASCQDNKQVVTMLSLMTTRTDLRIIPKLLFYLFKPRRENVFVAVVRAIGNLTGDYFPYYIEAMCSVIKPFFCTLTLFNSLLELMNEFPLIYPLCIIVAMNLIDPLENDENISLLLASKLKNPALQFKPSVVKKSNYWIIWPALLSKDLSVTEQLPLVYFAGTVLLDNFNIDYIDQCLILLDLISIIMNIDLTNFSSELIKLLADLNPLKNDLITTQLFRLCIRVLFLHNIDKSTSPEIEDVYQNSAFVQKSDHHIHLNCPPKRGKKKLGRSNSSITPQVLSLISKIAHDSPITEPAQLDSKGFEVLPSIDELSSSQTNLFTSSVEVSSAKRPKKHPFESSASSKSFKSIISELIEKASCLEIQKLCFRFNGHISLLQTALNLYKSIETPSQLDITLGKLIERIHDRVDVDVNLYNQLLEDIPKLLNDSNRNELLLKCQSQLIAHWTEIEKKAVFYAQAINSNIASIASGDIDLQVETTIHKMAYHDRNWRLLQQKVMRKSSPWENQAKPVVYKKKFSMCGVFEQPLIKQTPSFVSTFVDKPGIRMMCKVIKIDKQTPAIFAFDQEYFTLQRKSLTKYYKYTAITHILLRCPSHKPTACEIMFEGGKTLFIDFTPHNSMEVIQKLAKNSPNALAQTTTSFLQFFKKTNSTQLWQEGQITNFEYLMRLNIFCGRSFRHPALYPIFPWVILDFGSELIDFDQEEMMRDLRYPITAQTQIQRKMLDEKMNDGNCMYFTSPSNPTQIAHWLIRLQPFTNLYLDNEGGHFECDNRLFKSMSTTTIQVLESQNCWESTPEFYCLPEFLLDLNKIGIGDVELPLWSESPFDFVYIQRKALESDFVSKHLNNWIDLIFGIYLKKDSRIHFNSYNFILHEDIWQIQQEQQQKKEEEKENSSDFIQTQAPTDELIEITLSKSGHLPPMIFNDTHPERLIKKVEQKTNPVLVSFERPEIICSSLVSIENLLVYVVIFDGGVIESLFIDINNPFDSRGNTLKKLENNIPQLILPFNEGLFFMEKANSKTATIIKSNGNETNLQLPSQMKMISSCSNFVLGITFEGEVLDLITNKKLCTVLNETIYSIYYSNKFRMVLVGTPEGKIIAYSTHDRYLFTLNLPENAVAEKIIVTEMWAFIVVSCGRKLFLYNINGFFIKEAESKFDVSEWTTWTDQKGFDHIGVSDQNGNIYAFEAFYLSPESAIHHSCKSVTSINYIKEISSIVIITKDSRSVFIPYS